MRRPHHILHAKNLLPILAALLSLLFLYPLSTLAKQPETSDLSTAWERARTIGAYTFTADVVQHLVPRPVPEMIGQTDQRVDIRMDGDVTMPNSARLQLKIDGRGLDSTPLELVQNGTESYLLKNGERISIENPAGFSAPTADYLGYLAAAENIQQVTEDGAENARYTFTINGPRFAQHVQQQLQDQINEGMTVGGQRLPANATLSPSPVMQRMRGEGEIWLDAHGLPSRQIIKLTIPHATDQYDVRARIEIDFEFDESKLSALNAQPSFIDALPAKILNVEPEALNRNLLGLLVIVTIPTLILAYYRRRWMYKIIVSTVIASMLMTPLLQVIGLTHFKNAYAQEPTQTLVDVISEPESEILTPEPSTESETLTPEPVPSTEPVTQTLTPKPVSQTQAKPDALFLSSAASSEKLACGDGDTGKDTDEDGLADTTENCLGTDPYSEDSDSDTLTDTLEINGFDYGGRTWYSDPFKADSNGDGLVDFVEWPEPEGNAPELSDVADDWDPDNNGIPNLWDADNDGDGVPDALDLAPFSRSRYQEAFSLSTQGGDFDGYQYIEFQLQPQNMDHLRYGVTPLDWPFDELGQFQDLDDSLEDLRLTPMLKIQTNQVPDRELARNYGVTFFENEDENGYDMYAPMLPVEDGGQIVAFQTKVVYEPGKLDDIRWESVQLIWTVQMDVDKYSRGDISTSPTTIQTYTEDAIRITGFQITKSKDFQSAILGTPGDSDDRNLFNVLFGLSATFLNNQNPDLAEIETRFGNPNTDELETWGVPSTDVEIDLEPYGYGDSGIADMSARITDFLDDNGYADGSNPSLIIATQEDVGLYSLDDLGKFETEADLNVNLENIEMATQRSLKSNTYEKEDDDWQMLFLEDTIDIVLDRHDDVSADLEILEEDYPDITEDDLEALLILFYTAWFVGQTRVITIDGQELAPDSRSDEEVYDLLNQQADALPAYLVEAAALGEPGGGLKVGPNQNDVWTYRRDNEDTFKELGLTNNSSSFFDPDQQYKLEGARRTIGATFSAITAVQCIQWASTGRYLGLTGWSKTVKNFGWASRMRFGIRVLGTVGAALSVGAIWLQFGLTTDFSDPIARASGAAYAVAATIVTVVLFAISLNPVGAILVGLFILIDMIVYWATGGGSITGAMIKGIARFFYDVKARTEIKDFDFNNFDTRLTNPDDGVIQGNRMQLFSDFVGKVKRTSDGNRDDLDDSWIKGKYGASASTGVSYAVKNGKENCNRDGSTLTCENDVKAEYKFSNPKRDARLWFKEYVRAKTYIKECTFIGICWRDSLRHDLPEDLPASDEWSGSAFYVDVIPNSVEGLWNWSDITNNDIDGDGWLNNEESADPNLWDTDGDDLSDKFEFDQGSDPNEADTDGDGLNDELENRLGTGFDNVDSDDDGLTDGEEVFHWDGAQWTGGWDVELPDRAGTQRVYSDPLNADADDDGLDDTSERDNGTSPYAANEAPRLTLEADPFVKSPSGAAGVYANVGDDVTFTLILDNVGPYDFDDELKLCLPSFLGNLQYDATMSGDRNPATQSAGSNCLLWSFTGADTLQTYEVVSTTVAATFNAAASGEATASLPYVIEGENSTVKEQVSLIADNDNPTVNITAPVDGTILGGGISSYVIGGSSSDPSTWVDRVRLDLPGVGTVTADDTSPWVYTWNLPGDGNYSLSARAVDYLEHVSAPDTVSVMVDNTSPTVDMALPDGAFVTGTGDNLITVTLTGSAGDNLSGLVRVQVSTDGRPWREVWAEGGAPLSANWQTDWVLPNEESAQGKHTVEVRAIDRAGNQSGALHRTIIVDIMPPTDDLVDRTYLGDSPPHFPSTQPITFHGSANDAGNAPDPLRPKELVGSLSAGSDSTIWLGLAPRGADDSGVSITWIGDFNGDRLADLAVGLPAANGKTGRVTLINGRAGDWPLPPDVEDLADSWTSFIGTENAQVGDVILPAGDVDGDGFSDVLIGDSANSHAYVIFGKPNTLGRDIVLDGSTSPLWSKIALSGSGTIGDWLGSGGDVNDDGFDDLLIGSTGAKGRTYLLLGQARPWPQIVEPDETAAVEINTSTSGATARVVGDMDGDGNAEFAIGNNSTVYLFEGDDFSAGMLEPNETLDLSDANATFGASNQSAMAALGDVNGDSLADFIFANGDAPTVVFGDAGQNWGTHAFNNFHPAPSGFVAAPGDVDADGRADILLGTAYEQAYLILGDDLATIQSIMDDVENAASTPYLGGADLNSDGADDLLMVPSDNADLSVTSTFGAMAIANADTLPVISAGKEPVTFVSLSMLISPASILTVDDDGCSGCFTTLQAAIDAAVSGDTIEVKPGGYGATIVDGKDNLTISGVHPDAVFIDGNGGDYALKIQNSTGIKLEDLTLRNATDVLVLQNAGVDGYDDPDKLIKLDTAMVYDFTNHAVSMDRASAISITNSTLAGNDTHLGVTGNPDAALLAEWHTESTDSQTEANSGGGLAASSSRVYLAPGRSSNQIHRYAPASDSWDSSISDAPIGYNIGLMVDKDDHLWSLRADDWGGFDGPVYAIAYVNANKIYVGGNFHKAGGVDADYIAEWDGVTWQPLTGGTHEPGSAVHALDFDGSSTLYVGGEFGLRSYNGSVWYNLGDVGDGAVLAIARDTYQNDGDVYVGGTFDSIGGVGAKKIAKRNSSGVWRKIGGGDGVDDSNGSVQTMVVEGDSLYFAGKFRCLDLAGSGIWCNEIYNLAMVRLSDDAFRSAGNNGDEELDKSNDTIYTMGFINGDLFLGGDIDCADYEENKTCDRSAEEMVILDNGVFTTPPFLQANGNVYAHQIVGNHLYIAGDFTQVGGSVAANGVAYYDNFPSAGGTWHALGDGVSGGKVHTLAHNSGNTYIGGEFTQTDDTGAFRFARFDGSEWSRQALYEYDGSWHERAGLTAFIGDAAIAYDGDDTLYALLGNGTGDFYQYMLSSDAWIQQANLPGNAGSGASLTWGNGYLYALRGDATTRLYRYDPGGDSWSTLASAPITIGNGAAMVWDGGNWLYVLSGGNGRGYLRYHIPEDSWETLGDGQSSTGDDQDAPERVYTGGDLTRFGRELYGLPGGGETELWRYDPVGVYPQKLSFDHVAFVVPETTAAVTWLEVENESPYNLDRQPDDFEVSGNDNAWVGGSSTPWSPEPVTNPPFSGGNKLTHNQADFLDPARDIYRQDENSTLTAGYHIYRGEARYYSDSIINVYTSLQGAINSGANRVLLDPGVFEQDFYLINGVEVIGSGADATIIRARSGGADMMVSAEGVVGARLLGMTLDGNNEGVTGFRMDDSARFVTFKRNVVQNTDTAIHTLGSETDLEVVNTNIVYNTNGLVADDCASVDVRNTIFAHQTGTGLKYQSCASPKLHQYNLYWANGTDIDPAEPGAAELFLDPLFVDSGNGDYRTLDDSPVIEAGHPIDPTPPGTGERVDIGYLEQGRAAIYVDDDYCDECLNDGLTWNVDAFDTIASGLNKAKERVEALDLNCTVGVGPGTYAEAVQMPSYVSLVGVDPDEVFIDVSGISGVSAVTFSGVTHAELKNVTITDVPSPTVAISVTNTSRAITITRNLIANNDAGGITFSRQSSGQVEFNTLVDNKHRVDVATGGYTYHGDAIGSDGQGTWVVARNNVLYSSGFGFRTVNGGTIIEDYNAFYHNTYDFYDEDVDEYRPLAENDVESVAFEGGGSYHLTLRSWSKAIDGADPTADVPPGGGTRADMGYWEYRDPDPVQAVVLLGRQDESTTMGNSGVNEIEIGFSRVLDNSDPVTETLPSAWTAVTLDTPQETVSYWQSNFTPPQDGLYRFYSRATDVVNNEEEDETTWYDGTFVADSVVPVVTWLAPASGASSTSPLELMAQVSDYSGGKFSVDEIEFEVDGQIHTAEWAAVPWDEADGNPRVFRAWIDMTTGAHTNIIARAKDKAGNTGQSVLASLNITGPTPPESTPPLVTITSPVYGDVSTQTFTFAGTASDVGSGLASVEVSLDNGITWLPAEVSGTNWQLEWDGPEGQDYASYLVVVRAKDKAGNATEQSTVVRVDNVFPVSISPVEFSAKPGTHFDYPHNLKISWHKPLDGSGQGTVLLAVDKYTDTMPIVAVTGYSATRYLNEGGDWYVHLGAKDPMGNQFVWHYGPWHIGTFADALTNFSNRVQTIELDGEIDEDDLEWAANEFLDDDERPPLPIFNQYGGVEENQQIFFTWAGNALYMAWNGAWWAVDGTMWMVLDTATGGDTQPNIIPGIEPLPLGADYIVEVDDVDSGTLWTYVGGVWQSSELDFAHSDLGGTEIRVPLDVSSISNLGMMGFALDDDDNPWSVFPTTNGLDATWTDAYQWTDLANSFAPNLNQPMGTTIGMEVFPLQPPTAAWGPDTQLSQVVKITNYEGFPIGDLQLTISNTTELVNQGFEGGACAACPAGGDWLLNIPTLTTDTTMLFTITQQLGSDLSGLSMATTQIGLQLPSIGGTMPQESIDYRIDNQPPTVTVDPPNGALIGIGDKIVTGQADDGEGVGTDIVEYRFNGGDWQTADGTHHWGAPVTVPANTTSVTFEIRATDDYGYVSPVQSLTFVVDGVPPTVTMQLPLILTGSTTVITGTAKDSASKVDSVDVQFDDVDARWVSAYVEGPDVNGEQGWRYSWTLPPVDNMIYNARVRATDDLGNVSPANPWQLTFIDNVGPQITSTMVVSVTKPHSTTTQMILTGTVTDGGGVNDLVVSVTPPEGKVYTEASVIVGPGWSYSAIITKTGNYTFNVQSTDWVGNISDDGPFVLRVVPNFAPQAVDDSVSTAKDKACIITPIKNDIDADGDVLTITMVSTPDHGATLTNGRVITFTPTLNFTGTTAFSYTVTDGILSDTARITVRVGLNYIYYFPLIFKSGPKT